MEHSIFSARNYLDVADFTFSETQISEISFQICTALAHLHEAKIVYNGLRAESIMFTANFEVRLMDFSFSEIVPEDSKESREGGKTNYQRVSHYTAPEITLGKKYGTSADIWSLGILWHNL